MFSFPSPFCIFSERIEACAAKNSVPGFEIPGLAEVSVLLQSPAPEVDSVREKLCQGCGSLLNTAGNREFRAFFAEILALLEEQGSRVYLQAVKTAPAFADEEIFALPLLVVDFYRLAAERFSNGDLYTLFDTEISFADAWGWVETLNMPEVLKKYFAGFCADEFMFENRSASLKKILPNIKE